MHNVIDILLYAPLTKQRLYEHGVWEESSKVVDSSQIQSFFRQVLQLEFFLFNTDSRSESWKINKVCHVHILNFNKKVLPKKPQTANFVRHLKFLNRRRGSSPVCGSGRTVEILVDFSSTSLEEAKHCFSCIFNFSLDLWSKYFLSNQTKKLQFFNLTYLNGIKQFRQYSCRDFSTFPFFWW